LVGDANGRTQHAFLAQRRSLRRDRLDSFRDVDLLALAQEFETRGLDNLTLYGILQRMAARRKSNQVRDSATRSSKGEKR